MRKEAWTMKSILLSDRPYPGTSFDTDRVYSENVLTALETEAGLDRTIYSSQEVLASPEKFAGVRYIFSTWGMPGLSEAEIARCFPALQAVFYAAGSVQYFARPFLNRGISVFSAWAANAVPVAEYAAAQIVLANKGFFAASRAMSTGDLPGGNAAKAAAWGNYGGSVGIIGAGMVGKAVIRMLKHYNLRVLVFDPFLPDAAAAELGVEKCGLEELFVRCGVVSNHLANNEQTKGMLRGCHFAAMRPYATFLNTGRGAQVVEEELCRVLAERPDLTAVLDVTEPEPPLADSPFYGLPNCILSPHIAGSLGDEVCRMAEYMLEEFRLYTAGKPTRYSVTLKMLETMA